MRADRVMFSAVQRFMTSVIWYASALPMLPSSNYATGTHVGFWAAAGTLTRARKPVTRVRLRCL